MTTAISYDKKTIYYHWITAGLILALWLIGQNIDSFAKGGPKELVRSVHIFLGVVLAIVFVLRLRWKMVGGNRLPQAVPGLLGKVAIGVHHLLYLLIGLTVLVGMFSVWVRGDLIFNWIHIPAFDPSDVPLKKQVEHLHEYLANSLIVLASGHALMAVWHQFGLKDGVLKRMWPTLK
jgi:cytochrome b561